MEHTILARWLPAIVLVLLAGLHSLLGERLILGPLFAAGLPRIAVGRRFAERVLRFAWHLTSVAWLALAAIATRADSGQTAIIGWMLVASAVTAFVFGRGAHFAWALFAVGGLGALAGPHVSQLAPWAATFVAIVLGAVSLLHFAWAFGLRWGIDAAIPTEGGARRFTPPAWLTALVAMAIGAAAMLAVFAARDDARWASALCLLGALVFALRTIGDFRTAGLFKRVRATTFSRWDDLLYTPLCLSLSLSFAAIGARSLR